MCLISAIYPDSRPEQTSMTRMSIWTQAQFYDTMRSIKVNGGYDILGLRSGVGDNKNEGRRKRKGGSIDPEPPYLQPHKRSLYAAVAKQQTQWTWTPRGDPSQGQPSVWVQIPSAAPRLHSKYIRSCQGL